jgi:hypothetical protein
MQDITQLVEALQVRAWYPVAGIGVAVLLKILTLRSDWLFARLPRPLQWLPAAALMVGGAFVDAFQSGASWQVAIGLAVYAALSGTPMAVGSHHIGKRLIPALKTPRKTADRARRGTLAAIAALASLLSGCAAFQSAKPALQTADSLAQQACAVFFGQQRGMSVEDAAEAFCEAKEQYQPWLDALLRTDRAVERSLPRTE